MTLDMGIIFRAEHCVAHSLFQTFLFPSHDFDVSTTLQLRLTKSSARMNMMWGCGLLASTTQKAPLSRQNSSVHQTMILSIERKLAVKLGKLRCCKYY